MMIGSMFKFVIISIVATHSIVISGELLFTVCFCFLKPFVGLLQPLQPSLIGEFSKV